MSDKPRKYTVHQPTNPGGPTDGDCERCNETWPCAFVRSCVDFAEIKVEADTGQHMSDKPEANYTKVIDYHDARFYGEAFHFAEVVRRFLARNTTQKVIAAGLLDGDITKELIEANERIQKIRIERVEAARSAVTDRPYREGDDPIWEATVRGELDD